MVDEASTMSKADTKPDLKKNLKMSKMKCFIYGEQLIKLKS